MALLLFFLAGSLSSLCSYATFDLSQKKFEGLYGKTVTVTGTVTEVIWDGGYGGTYIIDVDKANDASSFSCVISGDGGIEENSRITAEVTFSPLSDDSAFNETRYYFSKGVPLKGEFRLISIEKNSRLTLPLLAHKVSDYLSRVFCDYLGEQEGGFAATLLLGNSDGLTPTVARDFTRIGISHALAISGMHLTVICAFISTLLKPLGKHFSRAGCALVVIFYMFITGFGPSVTRSGIMMLFLILASSFGKKSDGVTSLGLSVFIICALDPYSCADVGLQLSFMAVMAILLYTQKRAAPTADKKDLKKQGRIASFFCTVFRSLFEGIIVTVVVVLFMLPLEWLYFGSISAVSPLASPLYSALVSILLWTLPVLILISPAHTVASLFALPLSKLIDFICHTANSISMLRGITLSLNYPFAPYFCIAILLLVIVFCVTKKKKRLISSAAILLLFVSFVLCSCLTSLEAKDRAEVLPLSYKSCDGFFIVSDNKALLIDIGNGYSGILNEGAYALKSSPATEIEVLMLTHLHSAYPNTLDKFFGRNTVRKLVIPRIVGYDYSEYEMTAQKHKVELLFYESGEDVIFEDVTVKSFEPRYIKRSAQPLIRLDICAHGDIFTYLGGAYLEAFPDTPLSCDHLYLGSHGPLYKEIFALSPPEGCTVFACEDAQKYCSDPLAPSIMSSVFLEG